jgi:hypothetical protein
MPSGTRGHFLFNGNRKADSPGHRFARLCAARKEGFLFYLFFLPSLRSREGQGGESKSK